MPKNKKTVSLIILFLVVIAGLIFIFSRPSNTYSKLPLNDDGLIGGQKGTKDPKPKTSSRSAIVPDQYAGQILSKINKTTNLIEEQKRGAKLIDRSGVAYPIRQYKPQSIPNDPLSNQWWVSSIKQDLAWDQNIGEAETTLAIIDTGFALNHEEFENRWHKNSGEVGPSLSENPSRLNCAERGLSLQKSCNLIDDNFDGILDNESGIASYQNPSLLNCSAQGRPIDKSCNLIDDDANGLVDDVTGWDFVGYYPSVQAGKTNPSGSSTTHGTRVAGIAAATGGNAKGIAGVNWDTKILPIQAISDNGYGDTLTVSRAIRYAANQGADVISLSLGTYYPDNYLRKAVAYAISKGSMVVSAAGNDGCSCMVYPARYPEVIAVGATNTSDQRAYFSSYGSTLDIVAPGLSMTSSSWSASNPTNAYSGNLAGTSFATPVVSGLLSSLKSHQPTASNAQLLGVLLSSTNSLDIPKNVARTNLLGYGLIGANSSLDRVISGFVVPQVNVFKPVSGGRTLGSYEPASNFSVYQCQNDQKGSTVLYKLAKKVKIRSKKLKTKIIYTISPVEVYKAQALGYKATVISNNLCINLPSDTLQTVRFLSIQKEFINSTIK